MISLGFIGCPANSVLSDSRRAPTYYLLLGAAYRGLGDDAQARRSLAKAARLGGDSDVGKAAARLARGLSS